MSSSAAHTFLADQHPAPRADYVMANPPFNISEGWDGRLEGDPRWVYGTPPKSNANFAWVQYRFYHLAPHGFMALLLANGPMSSNTKGEDDIRRELFTNTEIPACVSFGSEKKTAAKFPAVSRLALAA